MINVNVPSGLESNNLEFSFAHRFYGPVDKDTGDTFMGTDTGANVGIGLRYNAWKILEARASRTTENKEYNLALSLTQPEPFMFLRAGLDANYINFSKPDNTRDRGWYIQIDIETEKFFRIKPAVNAGYDLYNRRIGLALGLNIEVIEGLNLIGEYYPVINVHNNNSRSIDAIGIGPVYALGIMLTAGYHHFVIQVCNNSAIGTRRLMEGTEEKKELYLGFNIQRLFQL